MTGEQCRAFKHPSGVVECAYKAVTAKKTGKCRHAFNVILIIILFQVPQAFTTPKEYMKNINFHEKKIFII